MVNGFESKNAYTKVYKLLMLTLYKFLLIYGFTFEKKILFMYVEEYQEKTIDLYFCSTNRGIKLEYVNLGYTSGRVFRGLHKAMERILGFYLMV